MKHLFGEHASTKMKPKSVKRFNGLAAMLVPVLVLLLVFCVPGMASAASDVVTSAASPSNGAPSVGDTIEVTININMTGAPGAALGSFDCTLDWDPAVLSYDSDSGVPDNFTGVVNAGNTGTGKFIFNGANPTGATGDIVVMTITFNVVGAGTTALDLNYSSMAAASTFVSLLPNLTINDGSVTAVQSHTVTFDANGGTGEMDPQTQIANIPAALTTNAFEKTGYTFNGWNTKDDGTGTAYEDCAEYAFDADITLYAQWKVNEYMISWDTDGDGEVDDTTEVAYGTMPSHADGSKDADAQYTYTFTGWSPTLAAVTGPATYTAQFSSTINEYTITFNSNGGSAVTSVTQNYGTEINAPVSTKAWYTLEGWYEDEELTSKVDFPYIITGDATFYAKWTINGLLGDVNDDGEVNPTDALIVLSYAAGLEVPPFPENIGDVNGDGEVNATDALIILSYAAGLEVSFPVGEAV